MRKKAHLMILVVAFIALFPAAASAKHGRWYKPPVETVTQAQGETPSLQTSQDYVQVETVIVPFPDRARAVSQENLVRLAVKLGAALMAIAFIGALICLFWDYVIQKIEGGHHAREVREQMRAGGNATRVAEA